MALQAYQKQFLEFVIETDALRFGDFTLKSGRLSPYFFNAGLFSTGDSIAKLGRYYAAAALASNIEFDMLFGPAYKGIPLAVATTIALADHHNQDVPFAFNRKEAKDHGEGGTIVGSPLARRVLIIDDVISAGTSVRESVALIRDAKAEPAGVVIALDRQERGKGALSAIQEVEQQYGLSVASIVTLDHLIEFLEEQNKVELVERIRDYRAQWGAPH